VERQISGPLKRPREPKITLPGPTSVSSRRRASNYILWSLNVLKMAHAKVTKALFQFQELILISARQIVFFSFTLALDYGSCLTRVIIPLLFQWHFRIRRYYRSQRESCTRSTRSEAPKTLFGNFLRGRVSNFHGGQNPRSERVSGSRFHTIEFGCSVPPC
jgi:hypothetical protein